MILSFTNPSPLTIDVVAAAPHSTVNGTITVLTGMDGQQYYVWEPYEEIAKRMREREEDLKRPR